MTGEGVEDFGIGPVTPRPAADLEPLLAWLRSGTSAEARMDFPAGTALPDGRLDLCKQELGPIGARAVAAALPEGGGPVRHLLLGTDGLGDSGVADVVPHAVEAGIETLYLGCNGITEGGTCQIAGQLIASPGVVKALWLKRNPVGASGVAAVADLLRADGGLRTVDLVQTGLEAADVAALACALDGRRVQRLYLGGNQLGAQGAVAAAELVASGSVEELYIAAARLGDAGADALADGLRRAPHGVLRRLSVASNGIGPAAVAGLVAAGASSGVELLDFGRVRAAGTLAAADNELDEASCALIGEALAERPHRLTYLDLRYTGMGSRGALRLLDGARRAAMPTRYLVGSGIAGRVKRELAALAADVPRPEPSPDVRAIQSVHRTA